MSKLIKISKDKSACFLCKKKASKEEIAKIEANFKPDTLNCDAKIA